MRLYLIGLPGSGKTTLGKELAKHLSLEFCDMDDLIVEKEGRSINDIFNTDGENYFRKVEETVLNGTLSYDNVIISTGGGTPCFFNNIELIKKSGKSIYIKVSPQEIVSRMLQSGASKDRPLLKEKSDDQLLQEITDKLRSREVFYNQADMIAAGDNLQVSDLINLIS